MPREDSEQTPLLGSPQTQKFPDNSFLGYDNPSWARYQQNSRSWSPSGFSHRGSIREPRTYLGENKPTWIDQFTSIDWLHDSISDAHRAQKLRSQRGLRGRINLIFDSSQDWILSALVGFLVAIIAFAVDVAEPYLFDLKDGICTRGLFLCKKQCCLGSEICQDWILWSKLIKIPYVNDKTVEFCILVFLVVLLSTVACLLTLTTKKVVSSAHQISTLDENLGAPRVARPSSDEPKPLEANVESSIIYYSAAGSGVAEVRVILSGFVLHGFLGVKVLAIKTIGLIFSLASGLCVGKEGPFVHIASCVGNIACRLFPKYEENDGKRREVLCAAAAAGIAVVFGAPIGGVLFSLEEMAYFFSAKTLFRTFFCCITAALTLKFLDPYGTRKIVTFEVRYVADWKFFELFAFVMVGILGGATGAAFIKACRVWAHFFRPFVKKWPLFEVILVSLVTGIISFWNPLTQVSVVKLLYLLASPCDPEKPDNTRLCPQNIDEILPIISSLSVALIIKGLLTVVTFGIKVPGGIYVPSMVVGGLGGRIIGHLMQLLVLRFPNSSFFGSCAANIKSGSCITPGIYALIAAGSTLCGVTRLSVTLVIILFELTGSLDHVLPFSLAILVAKWTADAMERLSIYDLLIEMNSLPYLNNRQKPIFTNKLAVLLPDDCLKRSINISSSPIVSARSLRDLLVMLQKAGEIDGGLPIIRNGLLVGLISAVDLEFALGKLENESTSFCRMNGTPSYDACTVSAEYDPINFTPYIDPAPFSLDIHSSMDLVYECFAKLGLRYICVLREGRFTGMIHKKNFVYYVRQIASEEENARKSM